MQFYFSYDFLPPQTHEVGITDHNILEMGKWGIRDIMGYSESLVADDGKHL